MKHFTLIAAHLLAVATVAAPAQTVSAYDAPITRTELAEAATTNLAIMAQTSPQYVANGVYMTLTALKADYPCSEGLFGRLAHVNDAWGSVRTTAVCEGNGSLLYWRPQRTDYAVTLSQTSGTITATPFVTAPIIYLSQTPTASMTVNFSTDNAWPGASFRIMAPATIGLATVTLSGLVGGGTVPLLQGTDKVVTYTCAPNGGACAWKAN